MSWLGLLPLKQLGSNKRPLELTTEPRRHHNHRLMTALIQR